MKPLNLINQDFEHKIDKSHWLPWPGSERFLFVFFLKQNRNLVKNKIKIIYSEGITFSYEYLICNDVHAIFYIYFDA